MNIVKSMLDCQAAVARNRWPDHTSSWRCAAVDGLSGSSSLLSCVFFPFLLLSRQPPVHVVLVVSKCGLQSIVGVVFLYSILVLT